ACESSQGGTTFVGTPQIGRAGQKPQRDSRSPQRSASTIYPALPGAVSSRLKRDEGGGRRVESGEWRAEGGGRREAESDGMFHQSALRVRDSKIVPGNRKC